MVVTFRNYFIFVTAFTKQSCTGSVAKYTFLYVLYIPQNRKGISSYCSNYDKIWQYTRTEWKIFKTNENFQKDKIFLHFKVLLVWGKIRCMVFTSLSCHLYFSFLSFRSQSNNFSTVVRPGSWLMKYRLELVLLTGSWQIWSKISVCLPEVMKD